ncbi:ClpXP adapter SpxH family protein [Caldibacillus debilis]|uniref:ClpXP adapter SpxH family protein n=1 Tax=Caldibacillus debilis TaxID=301148 RepID=UPI0023F2450D|nr:ClpXP adapter SpxH family protein [Caldibacillus debilis]
MKIVENKLESRTTKTCSENKPLELYIFTDPLCFKCWSLEMVIKKLELEYSHYFTLSYILSCKISRLNPACSGRKAKGGHPKTLLEYCLGSGREQERKNDPPFIASIAVKAAELQGKNKGIRFYRKLQEYLFYREMNITNPQTLIACAKEAGLDVEEFKKDIHSTSASKAFQCDLYVTNEMGVTDFPTVVMFTNNADEEGIKLTGNYPYEIYVKILREMLKREPEKSSLPPILTYLKMQKWVTAKEISFVYDRPKFQVELELKKLKLQKKVDRIKCERGEFWRYIGGD